MLRFFTLVLLLFASLNSEATVYIQVEQPTNVKVNFALPPFVLLNPELTPLSQLDDVRSKLENALEMTDYFKFVSPKAFLQKLTPTTLDKDGIRFQDWKGIGTDYLLTTGYNYKGSNLKVESRLFHVPSGTRIMGKEYSVHIGENRRLALTIANDIIIALTEKNGVFFSKIAFLSDTTGHKEIYEMDFDGENVKQLTRHRSITLAPSWSRDLKDIAYTVYRIRTNNIINPDIVRLNLEKHSTTPLASRLGLNTSPAFSPTRDELLVSYAPQGETTDLYIINTSGSIIKRLTEDDSINVEGAWSPDGNKITWVSSRRGNPMIFVMDRDGGEIRRLTYAGLFNASPSWSPDGKTIAFASQAGSTFDIYLISVDGKNIQRVTKSSGGESNEHPTFSPDGRHIIYSSSTSRRSDIYVVNLDGSGARCLTCKYRLGRSTSPSWSRN